MYGLTFDRLTLRLSIGIAFFVIGPLMLGFYWLSERQYDRGIEARLHKAESENRILEVALRHRMIDRDPALLEEVLREVASHPEVSNIMIVDHDGEVRIASHEGMIGERIPQDSPTCLVCHADDPARRKRWALLESLPSIVKLSG